MGDGAQYSTSTREPVGLPSISTFNNPIINSNNGFRDQHSPRFPVGQQHATHATGSASSNSSSNSAAAVPNSRPFSASISFAPLGSKNQPVTAMQKAPHHPSHPTTIFNTEPVPLGKKKVTPLKKHSPVPKNGPPPAKKLALTPLSPPKNGSNGGGGGGGPSGMPALEAALRSPIDADARMRMNAPLPGAMMGAAPSQQPQGPGMTPRGPPPPPMQPMQQHPATSRAAPMDYSLEGLEPFNPDGEMMGQPTSNGNNGYGYAPSPSNGHRGYFGETSRSPLTTLAPLEPLTTTFPTHSPVQHNGNSAYYGQDWSGPSLGQSLASPMPQPLPSLTTFFNTNSNLDQPHSSQYSSSPFSDPSPSLLSISLTPHQQQQQQQQGTAARPQSRPAADFGHYSGPLSHQSSSSIVWDEPPPPPTPTTHAAQLQQQGGMQPMQQGGQMQQKTAWQGGVMQQQQQQQQPGNVIRSRVKVLPGFESPQRPDEKLEAVQKILAQAQMEEISARKAAEERGEAPPTPTPVRAEVKIVKAPAGGGAGKGKVVREVVEKKPPDDPSEQEAHEKREKKRLAQNEARRKKRAEKMEQDRIKAESGQLTPRPLYPVQLQMPQQQHPHLLQQLQQVPPRPMQQQPQPLLQLSGQQQPLQPQQQPMRKLTESGETTCTLTASINAVARLDSGTHADHSRASSSSFNTSSSSSGASGGDHFSELRAAMLAEEIPLVTSRKESTTMPLLPPPPPPPPPPHHAPPAPGSIAAVNSNMRQPPQHATPTPRSVTHSAHSASASSSHTASSSSHQQKLVVKRKLTSAVEEARKKLMREYQRSLGSSIAPISVSQFAVVVENTRKIEEAQERAEWEMEQMHLRCAALAEQTKMMHTTMQMHLKRIANGEDTADLPVTAIPGQGVVREGFALKSLKILDQEIMWKRTGIDPDPERRRVSIGALLTPPSAPAASLRLAGSDADEKRVKEEVKETATASTMTEREEEREVKPTRRMMGDQSTRPLERCYLAGVKELLAEGYAVRDGGTVVRPRESSITRSGNAPSAVHVVDTEGRVWSEAPPHPHQLRSSSQNGVHHQRRNEDGEGGGEERSSGRVLRSAHRHHTPGYH